MGLDFADVAFRVEKQFGVRIKGDDVLAVWEIDDRNDCTVGEFHDLICRKCGEEGIAVPQGSWNQLKLLLVDTLGVAPSEITKEAWMRRDLGFD